MGMGARVALTGRRVGSSCDESRRAEAQLGQKRSKPIPRVPDLYGIEAFHSRDVHRPLASWSHTPNPMAQGPHFEGAGSGCDSCVMTAKICSQMEGVSRSTLLLCFRFHGHLLQTGSTRRGTPTSVTACPASLSAFSASAGAGAGACHKQILKATGRATGHGRPQEPRLAQIHLPPRPHSSPAGLCRTSCGESYA